MNSSGPSPAGHLHPDIRRSLRRFRRRWLALRGLTTLGTVLATAGAVFPLALLIDRYFLLPDAARLIVTTVSLATITGVALWKVGCLFRSLGSLSIARAMERLSPELDESLISTVQLTRRTSSGRQRLSSELLQALQESTAGELGRLRPETRLATHPAIAALSLGALVWLVIAGAFVLVPRSFGQLTERFLHPSSLLPRPSSVELEITPGSTVVATGTEVSVRAILVRGGATTAVLAWRGDGNPETREATLPFRADGGPGTLTRSFPPLDRALDYRLTAGDYRSPWYRIDVRDPPRPLRFTLAFHYPEYTRRPDLTKTGASGAFTTLEGTRVSIEVEASEPLAGASIRLLEAASVESGLMERPRSGQDASVARAGDPSVFPLVVDGRTARTAGIIARRALSGYELRLEGQDGVHNGGRARYPVEVRTDGSPAIALVSPRSTEISVEPTSVVELQYRAHDEIGLGRVTLVFHPETESASRVDLFAAGAEPLERIDTTYQLDVAALGLEPGGSVPFVLEVEDLAGQTARTAQRQLLAVFQPLYPEGAEWPQRLGQLEKLFESVLLDWTRLGPVVADDASPATIDAATIESLNAGAASAVELLSRIGRGADRMTELARSIAIASPQRRTLELLARRLRTAGLGSGTAFWTGLQEVLARAGADTPSGGVSFEELGRRFRATGAVLEASWIDLRALLRAEVVEDAMEHTRALALDEESLIETWRNRRREPPTGAGASTGLVERQQGLLRQATRIGARLASLSEGGGGSDPRLETLGRGYLQNAVAPLDAVRRALADEGDVDAAGKTALARLPWAMQDLADLRRRLVGQVNAVRDRLDGVDPVGRGLETLLELLARSTADTAPEAVGGQALDSILGSLDDLIVEVDEELGIVESMAYADLETVTDLASILKILEEARRDVLLGGREDFFPEEGGELLLAQSRPGPSDSMARGALAPIRDRLRKVGEAYRVTAPSRRLGLVIQNLDLVASSGEEATSRLRRAEPWKFREIRFHARALEEILEALRYATKRLTELYDGSQLNASQATILSSGLAAPLTRLARAASHLSEALAQLDLVQPVPRVDSGATTSRKDGGKTASGTEDPAAHLLASRGEARGAVLQVDEAILCAEELRKSLLTGDLAGAAAARRWLREQRGALAARVRRLADREESHAARVANAGREFARGGGRPSSQMLIEHEELRRAARELAEQARRDGEAALDAAGGLERSKHYDRAAGHLAAISHGEMLNASRLLRKAEEAPDDQVQKLYLEAADHEGRAVERLRALAQALGTLESDEALEDLAAELDALLGDSRGEEPPPERTIEEILAEARLLLEKSREATTTLAAKLVDSPRYRPVIDALRLATEHLQAAVGAAEKGEREPALRALEEGREKLKEAATLAREIRGDQRELVQSASESLAPDGGPENQTSPESPEMQALRREVEDLLAKLQASQALAREIDELFRDIVGGDGSETDPGDARDPKKLAELQEQLLEEFNERFMTLDQLVGLIAKILELEKESTTLKALEDELARRVLDEAAGSAPRRLAAVAEEQTRLTQIGEQLTDRFTKAGFRLTASLPQVMAAYWKGGDAAARVREAQTAARVELDKAAARGALGETEARSAAAMLLEAGSAVDTFLERLRETRQLALKAITEQESGIDESSLGQREIEASRSSLSQALEMMRQGRMKEAQAAHRQSMRSLAQATRAIRKGSSFELFAEGAPGEAGRGVDTSDDFDWKILTRGDESFDQLRFARGDVIELPYPVQFRELVRIYLKALEAGRR